MWEKKAKMSTRFDSFKVYIIRCFNEYEEFIKIGKTFNTLKNRYSSKKELPYKYEIITIYTFDTALDCCEKEVELLSLYFKFKYTPSLSFGGSSECFNLSILDLINNKTLDINEI